MGQKYVHDFITNAAKIICVLIWTMTEFNDPNLDPLTRVPMVDVMVLISYGNFELAAHAWSKICPLGKIEKNLIY